MTSPFEICPACNAPVEELVKCEYPFCDEEVCRGCMPEHEEAHIESGDSPNLDEFNSEDLMPC